MSANIDPATANLLLDLASERDAAVARAEAAEAERDTLREALRLNEQGFPHGISWREHPERPGEWHLNLHRDGWDIEIEVGGEETGFSASRHRAALGEGETT